MPPFEASATFTLLPDGAVVVTVTFALPVPVVAPPVAIAFTEYVAGETVDATTRVIVEDALPPGAIVTLPGEKLVVQPGKDDDRLNDRAAQMAVSVLLTDIV